MLRHLLAALLVGSAVLAPVTRSFAADETTASAQPFTEKQRDALDAAIKSYILANPQVLISSVEAYYKTQTDNKQSQEGKIEQFPAGLLDYPKNPTAGDKNAKLAIVEFFDYNCGYCKQVASDFKRIIADEPNIHYVFKELPILSETSEVAARYALAADMQGKYLAYHDALMSHQGGITEDYLVATAKDVGLDVEKMKKDSASQDIRDQLAKNVDLAREMGVRGTPFFVVGRQKVPGAIGYSKMKEMIAEERSGKPAAAATTAAPTPVTATTDTAPSATAATDDTAAATTAATPATSEATANYPADDGAGELAKAREDADALVKELRQQAADMKKQMDDMQKKAAAETTKTKPATSKK